MNSLAWAQVMCIFQLPAITGLRTVSFLFGSGGQLTARSRLTLNNGLLASKHNPIPSRQLTSSTEFNRTIHEHVTHLDALLGLSTGGDPAFPFQELIKLHLQCTLARR
jgi:hypothetical protein